MKSRLYLETSTLNAYWDDREPLRLRGTRRFWAELHHYESFVSTLVLRELEDCRDAHQSQRLANLVVGIPSLHVTDEAQALADRYIELGVFTARRRNDAMHVAIATVSGMDYLISWNYRHLVRERTRGGTQSANLQMGYNRVIKILTPIDLLGDTK